jgi:mannose-6-phosphate isomerase-like protein (cupin superfamily)
MGLIKDYIAFLAVYFGFKEDPRDKFISEVKYKIDHIKELYGGHYKSIYFSNLSSMPVDTLVEMGENAQLMVLNKAANQLNFIATFFGDLNFHNHPDASERFTLIAGEGKLVVKDSNGKTIREEVFEKGKWYTVKMGEHHSFQTDGKTITYGILTKEDK